MAHSLALDSDQPYEEISGKNMNNLFKGRNTVAVNGGVGGERGEGRNTNKMPPIVYENQSNRMTLRSSIAEIDIYRWRCGSDGGIVHN